MKIAPARQIRGRVCVPGDKSISHRAALIAALANGESVLRNFSNSDDCNATLSCLTSLGVAVERRGDDVFVMGQGLRGLNAPATELNCGNSGSTMRMLAGVLAGQDFTSTLNGDESLRQRPMQRVIEPLERTGARLNSENGRPPLVIRGTRNPRAIKYKLPIASAQLKSCLLLAGLQAEGRTTITEPTKTRDHTERMLQWFGVPLTISEGGLSISVEGPVSFEGREVQIPGDFSSAVYLIAAATLLRGSELEIDQVGLNPTRTHSLHLLEQLGAQIITRDLRQEYNEPFGVVRVQSRGPGPAECLRIEGELVAQLIDELPLLAVIGTQFGGVEIRDAAELRVKETDRIRATVTNLRAMGAMVEEYDEGMRVDGPVRLKGAQVDSFGDHRIAMAFAVAALIAEGETEIAGSACVAVSFPGFFEMLESIVDR